MAIETSPRGNVLKFIGKVEVAEQTLEFHLSRPTGFEFKAGQSMDLTLIDPAGAGAAGGTRSFSINSAPDEPELIFTTRLRESAFKRALQQLRPGALIRAEGPFGDFTLHNRVTRPAVLLAGGIGITPFRSIVRRAAREHLPHRIILIHCNRRPEDAPFQDELRRLEQENPHFVFVPTMTHAGESKHPWRGETGHISWAMISRYVPTTTGGQAPIYYVAGPIKLVHDLRAMLNAAGVDDDDIRTEDFSGYP